jgi:outer membrane lipoprotein-sorting protein
MQQRHPITGLIFMISGNQIRSLVAACAMVIATTAAAHDDGSFRAAMSSLAEVRESRVAYTEVKILSILQQPVEQTGLLTYVAPDTVIREVHQPREETYTISNNTLVINRQGQQEVTDLSTVPLLAAFIESFRATLSGNTSTLQAHYDVDFTGDEAGWRMQLRPRERSLANFVEEIIFSGQGVQIDAILITEANGDHSEMTLSPLAPVKQSGSGD